MKLMLFPLILVPLFFASPASADAGSFVSSASDAGFTGNLLRDGYAVCSAKADGGGFIDTALRRFLGRNDSRGDEFEALAVTHLCPDVG